MQILFWIIGRTWTFISLHVTYCDYADAKHRIQSSFFQLD